MQRIFVRRRAPFRLPFPSLEILKSQLNIDSLRSIEIIATYDLHNIEEFSSDEEQWSDVIRRVFADPVTDEALYELPESDFFFVIEYLPGQFDQRADSAEQCLALINSDYAKIKVLSSQTYLINGKLNEDELNRLKKYFINKVETREKDLENCDLPTPPQALEPPTYPEFLSLSADKLAEWRIEQNLAMTDADLSLVQKYFKNKKRVPTDSEIRVLDTYWSDHCRHSTFSTVIKSIIFPDDAYGAALKDDLFDIMEKRSHIYGEAANYRPVTLMELATIDAKYLKHIGKIPEVEFSEEVNACSVFVDVEYDKSESEQWLVQFKNETHNHPTEIEPFGGAATCIGGAIRDPLSGRAYVYQAMRISGSADPRQKINETLDGKLPQVTIAQKSAAGNSSYGNQIGLATGQVVEIYHQGYLAKHLELGAVVAAAPAKNVRRLEPIAGDLVLLLGGATGRDGIGGATGSSKSQNTQSLSECAAEVQKGNAPEERKLQRLFKNPAFAQKIKRCNDFGAGGVAVAVGELADGLHIDLDLIPLKYHGLNSTEIIISESQERMAIVIDKNDLEEIIKLASAENLTATLIAEVTAEKKLVIQCGGVTVVDLDRDFLNTNGAKNSIEEVRIDGMHSLELKQNVDDWYEILEKNLKSLEFADLRGLGDRFDYTVGASCVLKPYGGKYNSTAIEASIYLLPTENISSTASILSYGFNPHISAKNPYLGGMYAVIEAAAKIAASGGDINKTNFSLQEYFPKLGQDPNRWGLPVASLLGAHHALANINRAAIGGKDSMSGSFDRLDVPPTLVAFAVATCNAQHVCSPEFKAAHHQVYLLKTPLDDLGRPDFEQFLANCEFVRRGIFDGNIKSARSVRNGGLLQAIYESSIGNRIGILIEQNTPDLLTPLYGSFLISGSGGLGVSPNLIHLGHTRSDAVLSIAGTVADIEKMQKIQSSTLAEIYPLYPQQVEESSARTFKPVDLVKAKPISNKTATPRVCLPVFPGTNSELDTAKAFKRAGGIVKESVICNRNKENLQNSLKQFISELANSQILVFSGGFSAGDEPDGSGKFIANFLFNPLIADSVMEFLERDGLILGICNGFQALIKSGLLPDGEIKSPSKQSPTLFFNTIRRHISRIATTVVSNNKSPWLSNFEVGQMHDLAFSHGEGRFLCSEESIKILANQGQIATQYADPVTGTPSMRVEHNPNGSMFAIEGITDPSGRIFGKMGHSERWQNNLYQNHPDFKMQDIFSAGIKAFD